MKSSFAALALFVAVAVGQTLQINTPSNAVECEPTLLSWSGGTPPYFLSILPGNQPSAAALENLGQQTGTSFTWTTDIASGTSVGLTLRDNTGATAQSAAFTINAGSSAACVGKGSGTSSAASGSGAPGSTSSAAGPAPSSSAAASTTAPASSPSATATAPATTSKAPASSGTLTGTSTSSSAPAATSSGAAGSTLANMGVAGIVGAAAAALLL